jgi:hypothetical protein
MSVAFDHTGRYIAAVRKTHPPVLYHIDRDTSLVEFCQKGYGNTVTRKSVCFAGQKDEVRRSHIIRPRYILKTFWDRLFKAGLALTLVYNLTCCFRGCLYEPCKKG